MDDLDYIDRFSKDLEKLVLKNRALMESQESVHALIFANVKSVCVNEILSFKDENPELASYLEKFSNNILKTITLLENEEKVRKLKVRAKIDLLEEILDTAKSERNEIIRLKNHDGQAERKKREEKGLRKIGERPKSVREIKDNSKSNKERKDDFSIEEDQ